MGKLDVQDLERVGNQAEGKRRTYGHVARFFSTRRMTWLRLVVPFEKFRKQQSCKLIGQRMREIAFVLPVVRYAKCIRTWEIRQGASREMFAIK